MGAIQLRDSGSAAIREFAEAAELCLAIIEKSGDLIESQFLRAASLVGMAVCHESWSQPGSREALLSPAENTYRQALSICKARGIIENALQDLELIRSAGIEGLDPVVELLEGYLGVDVTGGSSNDGARQVQG